MYDIDGLLRDRRQLHALAESYAAARPAAELRDAKLKVTARCNLRCGMCHYGRRRAGPELDTERWCAVLSELRRLGCRKVHFSGGEPLMRPDLPDLVEHATALGLRANLTTNGTLIGKALARRLVRSGARSISVSLDGPTAGAHDAIRGQAGAFKRTVSAIELLRRCGSSRRRPLTIRINAVVMRDNYRRLPELARLAGELGADDVSFMPVDEHGASRRRLSGGQIARYNLEIAPRILEIRQQYGLGRRPERLFPFGTTERDIRYAKRGLYARGCYEKLPCFAPWLHLFVGWDGAIFPCCMTVERTEPLGDVRRQPLAAIIEAQPYRRFRQRFVAPAGVHEMCHRCDLFVADNRKLAAALGLTTTLTRSGAGAAAAPGRAPDRG